MGAQVTAVTSKNYLILCFDGFFDEPSMEQVAQKTVEEARKLQNGFTVITDIQNFKPTSTKASDIIGSAQKELIKMGMTRAIRVVGANVVGNLQFDRTGKQAGYPQSVKVEMAATIEDAQKMI